MLTRQAIAKFEAPYRRFRAELHRTTRIHNGSLAIWIDVRGPELVQAFIAGGEWAAANLTDYHAWLREQYASGIGLFR